jgi:uncharacterized protein (DUF885 family)
MRRILLLLAFSAPALCGAQTASERLDRLAAEQTERILDLFPVSEIFGRGAGPRQDRVELSFSDEHLERQRAFQRWVLKELEGIPRSELAPSEKLTHELMAWRAGTSLDRLSTPLHQHTAFIHLNGGLAFGLVQVVNRQPMRNEADYRAWFRRLQRYVPFIDDVGRVMREGAAAGITTPRVVAERTVSQLDALAPEDMTKSPLWKPMTGFPASIETAMRASLEAEYRKLLVAEVFPAIRRLTAYARTEYIPKARTTDGLGTLPGGDRMYRLAARHETTTDLTPDQIHELGIKEVKRIQAHYLAAAEKVGLKGTISDVGRALRDDPQLYPFTTGAQVIEHLYRIHARIVPQLPRLFGRMPKAAFEIRLTDPALAATTPAQYYAPSDDGRPGIFYMPVPNPRRASTVSLAALLAHEGMPGHHFEIGFKLENKLPEFRRRLTMNAYGEGWGLYAESLGHELGLYDNPMDLLGRYSMELFRAGRLVVDTGLHAKGWPRDKAIRYLVDECGSTQGGATVEVLRYMAWPGQALAYKIGELAILDLRAKAQGRLGARFDIRAFHDVVLAEGNLPLSLLEQHVESWIQGQLAIEGRWQKEFLIDRGIRSQDPRWELALHFGPGGRFSFLSRSAAEVRLTDGNAKPMVSEVAISGRWSVNGQGQVVIEFDRAPAGHEMSTLQSNLNYDPKLGTATVSADVDGTLMRLSGLERERQLYFRKATK